MMKLSPIRYGGAVVVPPDPTGNVWLMTDGLGFGSDVGEYNGTNWTELVNDRPGGIRGTMTRIGSYYYNGFSSSLVYYSTDLESWTLLGGTVNDANIQLHRLANDGTYAYVPRGYNVLARFTLPTGSMTTPSASSESYANAVAVWDGNLYVLSVIDNRVYESSDAGVNYTAKTEFRTLGTAVSTLYATSNADGIMVAFADNPSGPIKASWSTDGADSWTTSTPPITADTNPNVIDLFNHGNLIVLATLEGRTATWDGTSWTAGASVTGGIASIEPGYNKIIAINAAGDAYQSTDNCASWQAFTGATASDNASVYWIGDPL